MIVTRKVTLVKTSTSGRIALVHSGAIPKRGR
jgi:hypothetical protein